MDALEIYLRQCGELRGIGVEETSFYSALKQLVDSVGHELKPRVVYVPHPKGKEGNLPDAGLFPANQLPKAGQQGLPFEDPSKWKPERGAVEVKGLGESLDDLLKSDQVARYLQTYRQVLATNLREFAIIQLRQGKPVEVERITLATSEQAFWDLASQPKKSASRLGKPLVEFLNRTLLASTTIAEPSVLASYLASYAREARHALDLNDNILELQALKETLEEALGVKFEGEKGDDFFRSTLVQTIFYGIFSAWVLWHEGHPQPDERFQWMNAHHYLAVPVVDSLFRGATSKRVLEQTGIVRTLHNAEAVLNRVERGAFFEAFEKGLAVQYFYEPFLAAFDPELRKQLGVWYTPPEIVKYMVARVDRILKEELNEPEGLASPNVLVLDPCCGTGAYLVECLNLIAQRYKDRGEELIHGDDIKKAVTDRLFGFELLPGPFVVAHLQIGFLLAKLGVKLQGSDRAAIYLTNALTGWEPTEDVKKHLDPLLLFAESDAAAHVKQDKPILVVLGNPPYNGYAGISKIEEERDLVDRYRSGPARGQGLNDLYIRFYAMADRRIEQTGKGIVSFISNYSWLDGLSFAVMRRKLLENYSEIYVDNLHGDRIISEYSPDGKTSETIFAIRGQSVGIKPGTAIATLVKKAGHQPRSDLSIQYRDFDAARAEDRRKSMINALSSNDPLLAYTRIEPFEPLGYPFKVRSMGEAYFGWPKLTELMPTSFPGVKTSRDDLLVAIDLDRVNERMSMYFDTTVSEAEMKTTAPSAYRKDMESIDRSLRSSLLVRGRGMTQPRKFSYRPFDTRWLYWEPDQGLLDRPRPDYEPHVFGGNVALVAQQNARRDWSPPQLIRHMGCLDLMDRGASIVPHLLSPQKLQVPQGNLLADIEEVNEEPVYNLSKLALDYFEGKTNNVLTPDAIFRHVLAILHSPAYSEENAGALRQDWPRIPLPNNPDLLKQSADLGRQVAKWLDVESSIDSPFPNDIPQIASLRWDKDGIPQESSEDLALKASWGYRLPSGAVMPGNGKLVWNNKPSGQGSLVAASGPVTVDVLMNEHARWTNIPQEVWEYTLGGYQVLKKWLSYRERDVLGRPMKLAEVREFSNIARRIAALIAMGPQLDENYRACAENHWRPEQ